MRCKGKYPGEAHELDQFEAEGRKDLVELVVASLCGSENWEEVWSRAFETDEFYYNLYQCRECKRIVAMPKEFASSDSWI